MIAGFADRQRGVVTWRQMRSAGVGRQAISHRTARGRLRRLHRGVYAVGHRTLGPLAREQAAVLAHDPEGAKPPTAVLSHRSAAWLWGIVRDPPPQTDVTLIDRDRRPGDGISLHRVRRLDPADRTTRHAIPVTTPARTLLDLDAVLDAREMRRAFEEAVARRIASKTGLRAALDRSPGRSGTRTLRTLIAEDDEPHLTRLEAEKCFRELIREARLPPPRTNVHVVGYEVDAHWPRERLVIEVDSWTFHRTRAAFERDRRRDAELGAAGYRVMRVTWRQIVEEPAAVAVRVAQALLSKRAA